ncbi:MAG: C1 family peptidase [Bacteroidales bacterium]|nr:C1 family peptidase [Bacteroidales bacterium]
MKKIVLTLTLLVVMGNLFSQNLNSEMVEQLKSSYKPDAKDLAIRNAVTNNSINDLAFNRDFADKEDHYFEYEVKSGSITNQNSSGRCWMFTSLNVFRPVVMEKLNISNFEFSESYLYFWDILEKSNIFLERVIASGSEDIYSREVFTLFDSPVGDGGAWNSFTNLVVKYGVVPKDIMPESTQSKSTGKMIFLINEKLREGGLKIRDLISKKASKKEIQATKLAILKDVYRILAISLGEPPTEFQWRYKDEDGKISDYKTYTPLTFWEENVNANVDDYVMFIDDPTREYYKLYTKENDKNVYEGIDWTFVNVPSADLKAIAIESIKAGEIMYFSCDVGKQLSKTNGTLDLNNYDYESLFGVEFNMTREQRMLTHQSGSSHGMALCGVDLNAEGKPTKWKLENSWGGDYGNSGYLTMTDEWFTEYFFRLVINKKYLNTKILDVLKQKPEPVPYFNPAFSSDK